MGAFPQNPVLYALLMLTAGIGIPIMAALNAGLGARLENPAYSAMVLFLVALAGSVVFFTATQGLPRTLPPPGIPFQYYLGGLLVLFYVLSVTWVVPKFGIGNVVSFVLLGQLISMATIDHFALMGANQYPLTLQRLAGLVFMAAGVYLVVKK